jgi:hypothetical protein
VSKVKWNIKYSTLYSQKAKQKICQPQWEGVFPTKSSSRGAVRQESEEIAKIVESLVSGGRETVTDGIKKTLQQKICDPVLL